MTDFDSLVARARKSPARIALPEATDPRILQAASEAATDGRCHPLLIGDKKEITARAKELSLSLEGADIIDTQTTPLLSELASALYEKRKHKGMTEAEAADALKEPLVFACTLVHAGKADGCVAGAVIATADVTRSALQIVGAASDASIVSSFFLMNMKQEFQPLQGITVFADCALVVDPDATELAEIALQTARSTKQLLGINPVVAMLSFSTAGSAKHEHVEKVQAATRIARDSFANIDSQWKLIGDVQLDAAVIPEILAQKAPALSDTLKAGSGTAEKNNATDLPNILIFPTLDAGNIGYKLCERFGGCDAIGPVLQGLAKPVNDLSRGCKVNDISRILAITSLQAATRAATASDKMLDKPDSTR